MTFLVWLLFVFGGLAVATVLFCYFSYYERKQGKKQQAASSNSSSATSSNTKQTVETTAATTTATTGSSSKTAATSIKKLKHQRQHFKSSVPTVSHELLTAVLKGHTDTILDITFSHDSRTIITCSEDRTCQLFPNSATATSTTTTTAAPRSETSTGKFTLDYRPVSVASLAEHGVCLLAEKGTVCVYQNQEGKYREIKSSRTQHKRPKRIRSSHAGSVQYAVTGGDDSITCCFSFHNHLAKVDNIANINTHQFDMEDNQVTISASGRFISRSSFSGDVQIYENQHNKNSGEYAKTSHVMTLKGHRSRVGGVSFTADDKMAFTGSKDGTWRMWNLDVQYEFLDPPQLACVKTSEVDSTEPQDPTDYKDGGIFLCQCSPDGNWLLTCAHSTDVLVLWKVSTRHRTHVISFAQQVIHSVCWSPDSTSFAVAVSGKYAYAFRTPKK